MSCLRNCVSGWLGLSQTAPSLNPTATEFLPLIAVQETEGKGNGARSGGDCYLHHQMLCPGSYDGLSLWDAYHTQFKMLARINGWREEEKATYLAVSLKGPALTVLNNIPPESLYGYDALYLPWRPALVQYIRQSCIECISKQGRGEGTWTYLRISSVLLTWHTLRLHSPC